MDALLDTALKQAPEILHHLFALKGSNEILIALTTEESKAAYVLRTTAAGLEEVGKAMGSNIRCPRPCDIQYHINTSRCQFPSFPCHITVLNFGHFEDLYLASIATIKDYLQRLDTLITSNFKHSDEVLFIFPNEPLRALGPIRLGWLRACLLAQQDLLESDFFTRMLSRAIDSQAAHVSNARTPTSGSCGKASSNISSKKALTTLKPVEERTQLSSAVEVRQQIGRFETIRAFSCGMIFALLTEKHGPICPLQSPEDTRTPELPVPGPEIKSVHPGSFNPYRLNERVDRLDTSRPPGLPCSGHSTGLRVPISLGNPSREQPYQDGPSSVYRLPTYTDSLSSSIPRTTERTYPGNLGGSEAPLESMSTRNCPDLQACPLGYTDPDGPLLIGSHSMEETHRLGDHLATSQQTPLGRACMPRPQGSLHYYPSTTIYDYESGFLPLIHRRVFSGEELIRPFSKLCDTPPQGPSGLSIIGRRLFNFSRR